MLIMSSSAQTATRMISSLGLKRSIITAKSFQVATRLLSDNLRGTILPGGQPVSDTRRLLRYFRLDPQGRLLMGGRGSFDGEHRPDRYERLRRAAQRLFPQLGEPEWEFFWSGKVGAHGRSSAAYSRTETGRSRGDWAITGAVSRWLAAWASCWPIMSRVQRPETLGFPITRIKPLPFWSLRKPVLAALIHWVWVAGTGRSSGSAAAGGSCAFRPLGRAAARCRRNRTRSNHPASASPAHRIQGKPRRIGRHRWAWFRPERRPHCGQIRVDTSAGCVSLGSATIVTTRPPAA